MTDDNDRNRPENNRLPDIAEGGSVGPPTYDHEMFNIGSSDFIRE